MHRLYYYYTRKKGKRGYRGGGGDKEREGESGEKEEEEERRGRRRRGIPSSSFSLSLPRSLTLEVKARGRLWFSDAKGIERRVVGQGVCVCRVSRSVVVKAKWCVRKSFLFCVFCEKKVGENNFCRGEYRHEAFFFFGAAAGGKDTKERSLPLCGVGALCCFFACVCLSLSLYACGRGLLFLLVLFIKEIGVRMV